MYRVVYRVGCGVEVAVRVGRDEESTARPVGCLMQNRTVVARFVRPPRHVVVALMHSGRPEAVHCAPSDTMAISATGRPMWLEGHFAMAMSVAEGGFNVRRA